MSRRNTGTKNDAAWARLFEEYRIAQQIAQTGAFTITAEQINAFREARLMTKFDHRSNLPALFQDHRLAILPVTRGNYLIAPFDAYQRMPVTPDLARIPFPDYLQSLDPAHITSEAAAIHCAYVSGILADFTGDVDLVPTVSGRMGSDAFAFDIRNVMTGRLMRVQVDNSQIEIDGGYEGRRFLTLIEAKNSISENFLIRQLYYPFRTWKDRIAKPVKTIFLTYTNGIFSLYDYEFQKPEQYNSLTLVKQRNYCIEQEAITQQDLERVWRACSPRPEPDAPFPQADSFDRVMNLCELLYEHAELTREEITANYDFDARQTNYYTDAGRYLGLIAKHRQHGVSAYMLTGQGSGLFRLPYKARQLKLVGHILEHDAFRTPFRLYLERGCVPPKAEIAALMKASPLKQTYTDTTLERRAATVAAWLTWIARLSRHSAQLEMPL